MRPAALALLALAAGCVGPRTPMPAPPDAIRFLALGDSYTIGEGVDQESRWPVRLAAALRAESLAVGDPAIVAVTGWTTDELAAGLDRAEAEGRVGGTYGLVTLLVGVNDQYRGRTPEAYRPRLRDLLARAVALAGGEAGHVVVVSIPDWGVTPFAAGHDREAVARDIDAFNAVARAEAARVGARWADVTPLSRTQGDLVAADGLHPSAEAYAAWTVRILPEAQVALAPASR